MHHRHLPKEAKDYSPGFQCLCNRHKRLDPYHTRRIVIYAINISQCDNKLHQGSPAPRSPFFAVSPLTFNIAAAVTSRTIAHLAQNVACISTMRSMSSRSDSKHYGKEEGVSTTMETESPQARVIGKV